MGKYSSHKIYTNSAGDEVPSVTTILSILNKPALVKWANIMGFKRRNTDEILQRSADLGTLVHECIEAFLQKEKYNYPDGKDELKADFLERMDGFLSWYKKNEVEAMLQEVELVTDTYGGTCDFYGKLNGKHVVLDFKTSSNVYGSMFLQLAGYIIRLEEMDMEVEGAGILHISKKGTNLHYFPREKMEPYITVFRALVDLFHKWYDLSKADGWGDIVGK